MVGSLIYGPDPKIRYQVSLNVGNFHLSSMYQSYTERWGSWALDQATGGFLPPATLLQTHSQGEQSTDASDSSMRPGLYFLDGWCAFVEVRLIFEYRGLRVWVTCSAARDAPFRRLQAFSTATQCATHGKPIWWPQSAQKAQPNQCTPRHKTAAICI